MIRVPNVNIAALRVLGVALALGLAQSSQPCPAFARPKAKKPEPAAPAPSAPAPSPAPVEPLPAADSGAVSPAAVDAPAAPSASQPAPADVPSSRAPADAAAASADDRTQLASLQNDVAQLIDDMVQARARAALLGKTLFKTRLRLIVQNLAAPDPVLVSLVLKLDGAPVFRTDGSALRDDNPRQVFESFIAPGPHVLAVELEQRSQRDAAYGYTLHNSYRFEAVREKQSDLTLVVDDDSDLSEEFPQAAEGEYDVRTRLQVRTRALEKAGN